MAKKKLLKINFTNKVKIKKPLKPSCLTATGPNDNYHIKECLDICDNSGTIGCNNNTDVTNSFSQGGVKSCKSCSDHLTNPNADSDCAKDDNSMPCPNFADAACFSSQRSTQSAGIGGTYQSDTYHGCSAFRVQQVKLQNNLEHIE